MINITTSIRVAKRWLREGKEVFGTARLRFGYWTPCRVFDIRTRSGARCVRTNDLRWHPADGPFALILGQLRPQRPTP